MLLLYVFCLSLSLIVAESFSVEKKVVMSSSSRPTFEKYKELREKLTEEHSRHALGSDVQLNEREEQFNYMLMDFKADELARGFANPFNFTPSRHFFEILKSVESSPLFKLIRKMPKGAVLHTHDTAICSTDYVVSLTRWENLWQWGDIDDDDNLPRYLFAGKRPSSIDGTEWRLVRDIRKIVGDEAYERKIRRLFTLIVEDPLVEYTDINTVWNKFQRIFTVFFPLVTYTETWKDYYRQSLQEMYDDGVQYLEFRGVLPETYDLNGATYGPIETCQFYIDVLKDFKSKHPDFVGSRFIYAPMRAVNDETFNTYLPIMLKLQKNFPEFIAGFDLVGQEDRGRPLIEYAERLLKFPEDINFFFHAGETNWMGTTSDENLFDAVLLGTKRLGHGFSVAKYPHILRIIKERKIGIEVNPISNQVLKLVDDMRNHPCAMFFSDDYPVVISSDDPSFWGALPLSHDFYVAFLGIASAKQDLRTIKKLILNSFEFSTLNDQQKSAAKALWQEKWDVFIEEHLTEQKSAILLAT